MADKVKEEIGSAEDGNPQEIPYAAEYAKSNRASCKGCKEPIPKSSLRMAVRFPSRFFDGYQENWHHFDCFWKRAKKNDINETSIRGMEWLKWEDQELVRQRILELKDMPDNFGTPKSAEPKVEYAKSSAGKCFKCKEKIEKGKIRVGFRASFFHPKCFKEINDFAKDASSIAGFDSLNYEDKSHLKELFPDVQLEKKRKIEELDENVIGSSPKKAKSVVEDEDVRNKLKTQTDLLWKTREQLSKELSKTELEDLLEANGRAKSKKGGIDTILDQLIDCAVFGVPKACPECGTGKLLFNSAMHAYKCKGHATEYVPCPYSTKNPDRTSFKIPADIIKNHKFISKLKSPQLPNRVYPELSEKEPMINPNEQSTSFSKYNPAAAKKKKLLEEGGSKKVLIKNGCMVDSKCDVADETHVFIDPADNLPWQATLGASDFQSGKNSFYKLQLLKNDDSTTYYLFRAWGRVGTVIGGTKTEDFGPDLEACKEQFEFLFKDKTRNEWKDRHNFKKSPYGMDIIEVDFNSEKDANCKKLDIETSKSNLDRPIKELIAMIFDINAMKATLKEFEIDLEKMPLGKLSHKHILNAYRVLTELQDKLLAETPPTQTDFLDATNRFYTLIPHNTGLANPPLLNNLDIIKAKTEILDNLLELEVAFKIIKSKTMDTSASEKDPFDVNFEKLNCKMEVLDKQSEEFHLIKKYAKNTHGATHDSFKLEIIDVIKLDRADETNKFKSDLGNSHLLWHGSRVSNYAGILSKGLRIAPPEAPATGYMFGKGIYTADMVSKSANYCHATDSEGLLVLCEVALGEIKEEKRAKNIRRLKNGKNSVKGLGGTVPNPKEFVVKDGVIIPCGKPIPSDKKGLELIYNEYIVYNEEQVRLKYLVRAKFISKS